MDIRQDHHAAMDNGKELYQDQEKRPQVEQSGSVWWQRYSVGRTDSLQVCQTAPVLPRVWMEGVLTLPSPAVMPEEQQYRGGGGWKKVL